MHGEGQRWVNKKKYLKIHPSVWIVIVFFISIGRGKEFLFTFLFVSLHEMAHVITALLLGSKFSEILITPIGERAIIRNMELLAQRERFLILITGPLLNLTIGFLLKSLEQSNVWVPFLADLNLAIGFFNLLPIFPLDGGRILLLILENKIGTLNAAAGIVKAGKAISIVGVGLGIVQMILFPFNISLLMISLYLLECNKKEYLNISASFFMSMLKKRETMLKEPLRLKELFVKENMKLGQVVRMFSSDCYYMVCFQKNGEMVKKTQTEIMQMIMEKGMTFPIENC